MSTSKDCDLPGTDVLSPKVPVAVIGVVGLLLAGFALFRLFESRPAERAPKE